MKIPGYVLIAVLVLLLAIAAGCTTPQQTPAATQAPAATAAQQQQTYSAPAATRAASGADIDTTVNVHFNQLACISVQDLLGSDYLYPDQQFKLEAASPGTINVNILFVDENNQLKLREVEPAWDVVHKTWVYDGVVPVVRFIAITTPVDKTFTIKTQSKYYICADDRKEAGTGDIIYRVPVKLTRL